MARNPPDDPMADPELHGGAWSPWLGLEGDNEKEESRKEKMIKIRHCKLCKLKALFKKVGSEEDLILKVSSSSINCAKGSIVPQRS